MVKTAYSYLYRVPWQISAADPHPIRVSSGTNCATGLAQESPWRGVYTCRSEACIESAFFRKGSRYRVEGVKKEELL